MFRPCPLGLDLIFVIRLVDFGLDSRCVQRLLDCSMIPLFLRLDVAVFPPHAVSPARRRENPRSCAAPTVIVPSGPGLLSDADSACEIRPAWDSQTITTSVTVPQQIRFFFPFLVFSHFLAHDWFSKQNGWSTLKAFLFSSLV